MIGLISDFNDELISEMLQLIKVKIYRTKWLRF